jgi:hypothetical protein
MLKRVGAAGGEQDAHGAVPATKDFTTGAIRASWRRFGN